MAQSPPGQNKKKLQPPSANIPKRHVSALGVFAELDIIKPILQRHQQEANFKLAQTLTEKVKNIIPVLSRTQFDDASLARISEEVARESTRSILENIPKIQDFDQVPLVVCDSLTQSLVAHPQLEDNLKINEQKVFDTLAKNEPLQGTIPQVKDHLEKVAVLTQLSNIASLQNPNEEVRALVTNAVDQTIEAQYPLATPDVNQTHYGYAAGFLQTYTNNLNQEIAPQLAGGNIPSFAALQNAKSQAFEKASSELTKNATRYADRVKPTDLTYRIGFILGLDSKQTAITQATVPARPGRSSQFMLKAALASDSRQIELLNAALSHNEDWLRKNHGHVSEQVEKFRKQRSLTYSERIKYRNLQKQQMILGGALKFRTQKPKRAQGIMAIIRQGATSGVSLTYQSAHLSYQAAFGQIPGVFGPASLVSQTFLARNTLSLLPARFGLGDLWGSLKGSFMSPANIGMGFSLTKGTAVGLGIINSMRDLANRITKGLLGAIFGMALIFGALGKAAFMGFVIGGTAGAAAGLIAGAAIPVAIMGPAGIFLWPVTIPLGIATGGTIFGLAGGLIAVGLAAGMSVAVSAGVGAGLGGVIGAYTGGVAGATIGSLIAGACIYVTGGACGFLAPAIIATSTALGAAVGAIIGAFIGGVGGYFFGKYLLNPVTNFIGGVRDFFGGAGAISGGATGFAGAFSGAVGAFGSFATGLAATAWGGLSGLAGGALGFLSGATNFIVSGLSSISIPLSTITVPVFGAMGITATTAFFVSAFTLPAALSSIESEAPRQGGGDNDYFTVTKKARSVPFTIENSDVAPPQSARITFTITLIAKDQRLTDISMTDELTVRRENESFGIDQDDGGNPISPPCETSTDPPPDELAPHDSWNCEFTITIQNSAGRDFTNSAVNNLVIVTATPEGGSAIPGRDFAWVAVGTPPGCEDHPCGWPTTGTITQGLHMQGAIDIQGFTLADPDGDRVYATFTANADVFEDGDCGHGITLWSSNGLFHATYCHLSSREVSDGEQVIWGQLIGYQGYSGLTCYNDICGHDLGPEGTHLHYTFHNSVPMAPPNIPEEPDLYYVINSAP